MFCLPAHNLHQNASGSGCQTNSQNHKRLPKRREHAHRLSKRIPASQKPLIFMPMFNFQFHRTSCIVPCHPSYIYLYYNTYNPFQCAIFMRMCQASRTFIAGRRQTQWHRCQAHIIIIHLVECHRQVYVCITLSVSLSLSLLGLRPLLHLFKNAQRQPRKFVRSHGMEKLSLAPGRPKIRRHIPPNEQPCHAMPCHSCDVTDYYCSSSTSQPASQHRSACCNRCAFAWLNISNARHARHANILVYRKCSSCSHIHSSTSDPVQCASCI